MTTTEDIRIALQQAKQAFRAADNCANDAAEILVGRLRNGVSHYKLKQLKKELENYNMHTGRWK